MRGGDGAGRRRSATGASSAWRSSIPTTTPRCSRASRSWPPSTTLSAWHVAVAPARPRRRAPEEVLRARSTGATSTALRRLPCRGLRCWSIIGRSAGASSTRRPSSRSGAARQRSSRTAGTASQVLAAGDGVVAFVNTFRGHSAAGGEGEIDVSYGFVTVARRRAGSCVVSSSSRRTATRCWSRFDELLVERADTPAERVAAEWARRVHARDWAGRPRAVRRRLHPGAGRAAVLAVALRDARRVHRAAAGVRRDGTGRAHASSRSSPPTATSSRAA